MQSLQEIRKARRAHLDGAYEVHAADRHRALLGFTHPEDDTSPRWVLHMCDLDWDEDDVAPTRRIGIFDSSHEATEYARDLYRDWKQVQDMYR